MKFLEWLKANTDKVNGKITDEQSQAIIKVMDELGMNVLVDDTKSPSYFPKNRYDEVNTRNKELTQQIADLKKVTDEYEKLKPQLEAMKTAASENPLLKQQLEDLQKKIEAYPTQIQELQAKNQEWENKYKGTAIDAAVKLGLTNAKVNSKYADLLATKIDKSKLVLNEDGTIAGLDDQIKTVQEGYKELFGEQVPAGGGANPPGGGSNSKTDAQKLSDDYDAAMKAGNLAQAIAIKNKFTALTQQK